MAVGCGPSDPWRGVGAMKFRCAVSSHPGRLSLLLIAALFATSPVLAGNRYVGDPDNYRSFVSRLQAGDRLQLLPGVYKQGLPVVRLTGSREAPIVIEGLYEDEQRPVFLAREGYNTISIIDSGHVVIRNLVLDGRHLPGLDAVKAEGNARWAHHITLENLWIRNHGGSQLTVGISTKCPAWGWIIRGNIIQSAGTGIYLGQPDGTAPFVDGLIENNLVADSLGYGLQIKHQKFRKPVPGMPAESSGTTIRNNVFSKVANASQGAESRPNVLVGHFPPYGNGAGDWYFIHGNLFYDNATEALFQGEGNVALYNNVFINPHGDAINIRPHNDVPRKVYVFFNTVLASGTGIALRGQVQPEEWNVSANAVFASRNLIGWLKGEPLTAPFQDAADYLRAPFAPPGQLDLRPLGSKFSEQFEVRTYARFPGWDRDFDGEPRLQGRRGAYAGTGQSPGWRIRIEPKPLVKSP